MSNMIKYNQTFAIMLTIYQLNEEIINWILNNKNIIHDVFKNIDSDCVKYIKLLAMLLKSDCDNFHLKLIYDTIDAVDISLISIINNLVSNDIVSRNLIEGQMKSELHCHKCNNTIMNSSKFTTLELPLPAHVIPTMTILNCLETCINIFMYCDQCNEKTNSSKLIHVVTPPTILIFTFDNDASAIYKIPCIPDEITLNASIYVLTACTVRINDAIHFSYVLFNGIWYMIQNNSIRQILCGVINNMQRCKMLLYVKKKC